MAAMAIAGALTLAACGDDEPAGSASTGDGLPATVKLMSINDITGAAAFAGKPVEEGMSFAIDQINESKLLGETKLSLDVEDTTTNPQQAVRLVTDAAKSDVPVIFSPATSGEVLATAPIAQRAGVPYILATAADMDLVNIGDAIFRVTAPSGTYVSAMAKYLASKGEKEAALIYLSAPGNIQWGTESMPPALEKEGIKVVHSLEITATQTDFSSIASRLRNFDGAVGMSITGPSNGTLINQLRQQGFKGRIFGDLGFSGGGLDAAGKAADGALYSSDFSVVSEAPSAKKFVADWKAAKGQDPSNFHAAGYNRVYFAALGLKKAGSTDRGAVRDALESIAAAGFDGATGRVRFEGRDARTDGYVNQIDENGNVVKPE
jgi:branched-chain amino acid transport system substrate-binding protein